MLELSASYFFDFEAMDSPWKEVFDPSAPAWLMLTAMDQWMSEKKQWSIRCPIPEGVTLIHPELIDIDESCLLEPGCYIQGPCVIGAHTQIRHGAYLRGQTLIGKSCVIGHTTELKHAIFLNGAKAGHFAYVGDTILGAEVNLGAGVKCANFRLDHGEISLTYQGQKHPTSLKKLGAILGDGCQIGCNSVLNPGTLVGPRSHLYPLINLSGFWPQDSRIQNPHSTVRSPY